VALSRGACAPRSTRQTGHLAALEKLAGERFLVTVVMGADVMSKNIKNMIDVKSPGQKIEPYPWQKLMEQAGDVLGATADHISGYADPDSKIASISVVRGDHRTAHWSIFLHEVNGKIDKVDLIEDGYRILCGSMVQIPTSNAIVEPLPLKIQPTLGYVCKAVAYICGSKGAWTGNRNYNCQDFVIIIMNLLGVPQDLIMPYRVRRTLTKPSNENPEGIITDPHNWVFL
jgi:hypothetical protein